METKIQVSMTRTEQILRNALKPHDSEEIKLLKL